MKQLKFFKEESTTQFGGELLKNKRRSRRPLSTKRPIHLVLRGNISQSGSLRRKKHFVGATIKHFANKFNLKLYRLAINSNHAHLLIKIERREDFHAFARAVAGVLAQSLKIKWLFRPFTRLLTWGRDFAKTCQYVLQNEFEAAGVIAYTPRKRKKTAAFNSS